MSVGHGTPGLRDFLRPFADLVDDVDADRRPIIEFFPGVELTAAKWTLYSGSAYGYAGQIQYTLDGALRDIVGVDTDLGPLTRAESLADVVATAGTFFAQVGTAAVIPTWDDGVTLWDSGQTFDQVGSLDLYVHLPGGVAASAHTIVPLLGFYFGSRSEIHPRLGPDKLTNGPLESLNGWTESLSGAGFSSALDSVLFTGRGSTSSLKLVSTGAATGSATRRQYLPYWDDGVTTWDSGETFDQMGSLGLPAVIGQLYRLSGDYRTDLLFSASLEARLLVGDRAGTIFLYSDGRTWDASGGVTLKPTVGEWRRFMFDFVAPATTLRVQLQLLAASSAGAGQLNFDNVKLQRIYGFQYYDPRLAADSLPDVEVASQSIFFAGKTIGLGDFTLMNADGVLDSIFGQLLLKNRTANVLVGGAFPDGQEVYRDDYRGGWPGLTQMVEADDVGISFQTEDARARIHVTLPPRTHSLADDSAMSLNDEGYARKIVFATNAWDGLDTGLGSPSSAPILWKPVRVGLTSNGYGIYEVGDVSGSVAGMHDSKICVVVYATEESAEKNTNGDWVIPGQWSVDHFSYDRATGLLTVLSDIRAYNRRRLNSSEVAAWSIEFDIGGGTFFTGLVSGTYISATGLAGSLQSGMRTQSGAGDIFVTFSHSTKKFTFAKTAGTLNLRMNDASRTAWEIVGFDAAADHTGALSYTGENATFGDVDAEHIIRVAANGLRDDAAGTFTGTASNPVVKHPDVARYVLRHYLSIPATEIDAASFAAGRALDSGGVRVALQERIESGEFLARLELGALADLVLDSERVWRWRAYQAGAAAMRDFFDRDFLTFKCSQNPANIFKATRVRYGHNPARESSKTYEYTADSDIPTKHGRVEVQELDSLMDANLDSVAQTQTQRLARLAAADPLVVEFSSRGKLVDLLIGDVITITRARALTSTGALSATRFLVRALRHNFLTGVSTCMAVEDVAFLT